MKMLRFGKGPEPVKKANACEVYPFKKGPELVKKENAYEARRPMTLSRNNEWGCTNPGVSGEPPSGLGGSRPRIVAALSSALVRRRRRLD